MHQKPKPHFLNNIFNSNDFNKEELEAILPKFKQKAFKKNSFLLEQGKAANEYWFVESGFIRSFVLDIKGNDITTNFYSVDDIVIDWPSFFLRNPTRENIQALTDCVCWQLDFDTFQKLFHSIESFREQGRTTLVKSYFNLKSHNISMIADQAKERYENLLKENPLIIQNVSLKHIATYLGITDTSLSRIRKEISSE
ncbi:Crp/Fnr family transcriptional regulator [Cellulophaga baltica]|uniref:cAMP-binding domain of CRP or a regulatory subunit of cAMP-dependent protein kinases n=2 Tax=Cellulophaga baltica TaxID=76594 RepID=A0A1G7EFW7_9FLAO|nr:Crp/Fnr family transcriptional regulator [Cellulophaga baltica]MBA6314345.1 Crp/Fnr family transcriptional regulator [Cellulophaga baltica]SDE62531.1 cAMP-binding domain of CRP or a regulatory subunit of cAMP-dependent protein kinases [Cellulophaga baltica]